MKKFTITVSPSEYRRLDEFVKALRTPCSVKLNENSIYKTDAFENEFRSKLLTHHYFIGSPLYQDSFDSAFIRACCNAGFEVESALVGQRFWDVKVNGKRISLKTTKAKSLSKSTLHISKLTEAAWIQDCRNAKMRQQETFKLFNEYCKEVDVIIQLRYFQNAHVYELVEVPVRLFEQILQIEREHFTSDGPTINIPIGSLPPDFTLKLDRSDAKITIANINKTLCMVHGEWQMEC